MRMPHCNCHRVVLLCVLQRHCPIFSALHLPKLLSPLHFTSASGLTPPMTPHDPTDDLGPLTLLESVRLTHMQVMQADVCTIRGVVDTVGVVCEFVVGHE